MADELDLNSTPEDSSPPEAESFEVAGESPQEPESAEPETPQEPESADAETPPAKAEGPGARTGEEDKNLEDAMLKMLDDLPQEESSADSISFESSSAAKAEFQQLSQPSNSENPSNIDLFMDVYLPVSIELGRTKMSISDILALGPGSVVELARLAGEPVDVMVNHKLVARGEVVVVDENFGVRVTQLITPEERIKLLGDE